MVATPTTTVVSTVKATEWWEPQVQRGNMEEEEGPEQQFQQPTVAAEFWSKYQCGVQPGWPERLPTASPTTMADDRTEGPAYWSAPAKPTIWK